MRPLRHWRTGPEYLVAVLGLLVAACSWLPGRSPAAAQPCDAVYPAARCVLMGDRAAENLGVDPGAVTTLMIVPGPEVDDGNIVHSGGTRIYVEVTLTDGSTRQTAMCGGVDSGPACTNDPHIATGEVGGYRDIPCAGDQPSGCATPLPSFDPKAMTAARPIVVARLDVPIDHVGAYEVDVGRGSLPNGVLTRTSFALADDWPADVTITDGAVRLEVRSLETEGKPFQNYYDHGWRVGIERVKAVLLFSVTRFKPGAVLQVRDVVVK